MAGIREIAKQANVSPATVSRAFNGHPDVLAATRQRVLAVAARLNYAPSSFARNLRQLRPHAQPRTHVIGLLFFDFEKFRSNPFIWEVIVKTEAALADRGYGARLQPCSHQGHVPRCIEERAVDGVICSGAGKIVREIARAVPVVTIDYAERGSGVYGLVPDYRSGVAAAVGRLLDAGHERLAMLTGEVGREEGLLFPREVIAGAQEAFASRKRKLPPMRDLVPCLADNPALGYAAGKRLFADSRNRPDAVVASDAAVLGLYRALNELGLRVPDDVSVVGIDGLEQSAFLSPPLTTLDTHIAEVTEQSVRVVLEMIETGKRRTGVEFTPVTLVERDSARLGDAGLS